jgi:hypothetical protein
MKLSRRALFRYGAASALLVAAADGPIARAQPAPGLALLSPGERDTLVAAAERIVPGGDGLPAPGDIGVAAKVDAAMTLLHPADVEEIRQGLMLLESAVVGLLLDARPTRFTDCDPAARDEALADWRSSRITLRRKAFKAIHGLISAAYWASPEVYPGIGYPGPPDFRTAEERAADGDGGEE